LYGGAAWAGVATYREACRVVPWWLALFPGAFVAIVALIAEVSVGSMLCPRLTAGRYTMMRGRVFFGWIFRSMFRRILFVPGIRWIVMSFNTLRWLAFRGMGANIAFASNMSADAELLDPSLVTIERGATIGARCVVSCHYVENGKLVLGEVKIGAGALLALDVVVAPHVTIGANAFLGARASVSVGATVGERARIGGAAVIDTGARVGARAQVGTNAYIPPRAEVPDHGRIDAATSASSTTSSAAPDV
jgi:UDP-3-O-[3-hydroxymyristoyl] glucosamine N-acyltransferase